MSDDKSAKSGKPTSSTNKLVKKGAIKTSYSNSEYKLGSNGSYDIFIKKLEEKLDTMSNNNQYLNIVWDQVTKKLLNANVLDAEIAPLPPNIMPIEIAIAKKNPLEAINRQVLANRRSLGIAGRELNAIVTPVEELEAIQQLETAKLAYQTMANMIEVEKLKLKAAVDRAEHFRTNFDKNLKVISATITATLSDNLTISNLKKTYGGAYETSFNELEIVQRFLNSLHDKNAYIHYSNAAIFGTAAWPETYQAAKVKVLESLDEKRSRSDRTTGFVFNTLPSAKKKDHAKKKVISNDKDYAKKKAISNDKADKKDTADEKPKKSNGNDEGCWICGSTQHMCKACPDRKGDIERNLMCFIYMLNDSDDEITDNELCIIFDSGATKSIYGNIELVEEINDLDEPIIVRTINGSTAIR